MMVIQAYASTNNAEEVEVEWFYEDVEDILELTPENDVLFIAALFTIARIWKQPRCPSADKWIRKLWYICTME